MYNFKIDLYNGFFEDDESEFFVRDNYNMPLQKNAMRLSRISNTWYNSRNPTYYREYCYYIDYFNWNGKMNQKKASTVMETIITMISKKCPFTWIYPEIEYKISEEKYTNRNYDYIFDWYYND